MSVSQGQKNDGGTHSGLISATLLRRTLYTLGPLLCGLGLGLGLALAGSESVTSNYEAVQGTYNGEQVSLSHRHIAVQ